MYENKEIAARMKGEPDVKKYMKKVMPYVQMVKERFEQIGIRALDLTSPFDEMDILNQNIDYMAQTLELDGIDVRICFLPLQWFPSNRHNRRQKNGLIGILGKKICLLDGKLKISKKKIGN